MSDELRTEEEQVEALKKWWDENGKSLIVTIVLVLGGYLGWNGYQDSVEAKGQAAATVYHELMTKASVPAEQQSEADKTEMMTLAVQLEDEFEGTLYADFAGLFKAKFAVEAQQYDEAVTVLKALSINSEGPVQFLAQIRLARVYVQQEQLDDALALIETVKDPAFKAQADEVKGDVLYAKGEFLDARRAYQSALIAAQSLGTDTQLLQRKVDDLAGEAAEVEVVETQETTEAVVSE